MSILEEAKKKTPWFYNQTVSPKRFEPAYKPSLVRPKFCKNCQTITIQVRLIEALSGRIHWLCRSCGMMVTKP